MRPHELTIKAFGPFAEVTTVDFDAMGNSVYLIAGETGAGKTSIFDALVYALYGTASGSGRSGLSTEELHSDLAKHGEKKEEMKVSLRFSNAGKEYCVTRRMYWGKNGSSKTVTRESELSENGNLLTADKGSEKNDDVTKKIKEILGLDADQFRRIIMLAQGEFRKFLESDDKARGEILGKLYDNRRHLDIQARLKAARDHLKKKETGLTQEITAALGLFKTPEDVAEEEKEKLAENHPELLFVMEQLTERLEKSAAEVTAEREKLQKKLTDLTEQKAAAEAGNKILDDLDAAKKDRDSLEEKSGEYDNLRTTLCRAESAAKVLPSETAKKKAEEDLQNILDALDDLVKKEKELEEKQKSLKEEYEQVEKKNNAEMNTYNQQKTKLEQVLSVYDSLEKNAAEFSAKEELKKETEKAVSAAEEALTEKKAEQEKNREILKALEHAGDSEVEAAELRKKSCIDREEKFSALKTLVSEMKGLENALENLKIESGMAAEKALKAEENHLELNKRFLAGQAGFLADEMREKLEKEASVICPVCGTAHTKGDIAGFAAHEEDVPSRKEVDDALAEWTTLNRESSDAEKAVTEKKTEVNGKRTKALEDAAALGAASDWETLSDEKLLSEKIKECEKEKKAAAEAYGKAVEDRTKKQQAQEDEIRLADEVTEAGRLLEEKKAADTKALNEKTAAETRLAETKKQLEGYPEKKSEAEQQIASARKKVNELAGEIAAALKDLRDCQNELSICTGNIQTTKENRKKQELEKEHTKEKFTEALSGNGFSDENDYHSAMEPEGDLLDGNALDNWIRSTENDLRTYEESLSKKRTAVTTLEASAKGIERKDTKVLAEQLCENSGQDNTLKQKEQELSAKSTTDREVTGKMKVLFSRRKNVRKALDKIGPLDDAAGGKLSFSRYVLGEFFDSIIEQANAHLDTMTDGEYCIVHGNDSDERLTQGLGLRVLNTVTGFERANATLSGGQSFEAALSLALGLSDVVQMQAASTVQIDSMYIDEGFGSLDGKRLDNALTVLSRVSGGNRQIGIISHVDRLEECLTKKIRVISGEKGSTVTTEVDG